MHTVAKVKETVISKVKKLSIKKLIVGTVEKVKGVIHLNRILWHLKLSSGKYYSWLKQVKKNCIDSPLGKCFRIWPNQLTKKEVSVIKKYLTDQKYKGWPIRSLCWLAYNRKELISCSSTWYRYAGLLGIIRKLPLSRRKKNKTGIRALKPHEIWHCDVVVFTTMDNIKCHIYIVMDNFSRFILNWKVSLELSGKTCLENIREAYIKYIKPLKDKENDTMLMMDGGSENNNELVDGFINQEEISIKKIIALKEIDFSNSIIESFNKLLKYRFLFTRKLHNYEDTVKYLNEAIPVYNSVRPHGTNYFYGLTPEQRLNGEKRNRKELRELFENARKLRVKTNRKAGCPVCIG